MEVPFHVLKIANFSFCEMVHIAKSFIVVNVNRLMLTSHEKLISKFKIISSTRKQNVKSQIIPFSSKLAWILLHRIEKKILSHKVYLLV